MEDDPLWFKDAIIYEVHVKAFYDSSNDGIGDFRGLTQKLDYLSDLGITAIWLLPFYPSPLKDDGYDISDYKEVHPFYGTLADFKLFLKEAHKRSIRVIIELIVNHTSDQHPWFQRARAAKKDSNFRNYYVWSDSPEKYKDARIIFKDFETSNWTWDPIAHAYYWHRFYSHQPDLNFANATVRQEMFRILEFWLRLGVDGCRLDAVPYLFEKEGTDCENLLETHQFLKDLRKFVQQKFSDRMLLAEANQWPEDAAKYFGAGDECHMAFHFPMMPRLFMAIHLEDSLPIIEIEKQTPTIPENCQWALFLRNHDELTLEMVTDEDRDYMFRIYAHDIRARINLGIRRRLAPLLKNDRRKIELMNSLLFSLVGTPVLYYGDEIGMGDNIYLGDRDGVRTPMQWSPDRNAGFSKTNPQRLYLPPIIDPEYHYETINVESQQNNPFSLLFWTKHMISLRKRHKAFGRGSTEFLKSDNPKILCFIRKYKDEELLIIANLSRYVQFAHLDMSKYTGSDLIELFSGARFPKISEQPVFLTLSPYCYYWFAIDTKEKLLKITSGEEIEKIPLLTFMGPEEKLFSSLVKKTFDYHLTHYLAYSDILRRSTKVEGVNLIDYFHFLSSEGERSYLVIIEVRYNEYESEKYFILLEFLDKAEAMRFPKRIISRWFNENDVEKFLCDVSFEQKTGQTIFSYFFKNHRMRGKVGELQRVFPQSSHLQSLLAHLYDPFSFKIKQHHLEIFYKDHIIKIFFPIDDGLNIDIEMKTYLSENTTFRNFFPLLGYIEYKHPDMRTCALGAILKKEEQGHNALEYGIQETESLFEKLLINNTGENSSKELNLPNRSWLTLAKENLNPEIEKVFGGYLEMMKILAENTAQFHLSMNAPTNNANFTPENYTFFYQRSLYQTARRKILEYFNELKKISKEYPEEEIFQKILRHETDVYNFFDYYLKIKASAPRIRIHGNYCLDHLFYTGKEFLIVDFEREDFLSFNERRFKRSALRDVASLLFSFVEVGLRALQRLDQKGFLVHHKHRKKTDMALSWSIWVGVSFLKNYLEKMKDSSLLFSDDKAMDIFLGMFFLERIIEKSKSYCKSEPETMRYFCRVFMHWLDVYLAITPMENSHEAP